MKANEGCFLCRRDVCVSVSPLVPIRSVDLASEMSERPLLDGYMQPRRHRRRRGGRWGGGETKRQERKAFLGEAKRARSGCRCSEHGRGRGSRVISDIKHEIACRIVRKSRRRNPSASPKSLKRARNFGFSFSIYRGSILISGGVARSNPILLAARGLRSRDYRS